MNAFIFNRVRITVIVTILLNTCTTGYHAAKLFRALFTFGSQYCSIHILLSESISCSELRMTGALLNHFYAEYQNSMNFCMQ